MRCRLSRAFAASFVLLLATPVQADSLVGVCPDGSAFIVARRADAPCARAKFVEDATQLPPLRPELLPEPYTWTLDQQARDPNNPYNLIDAAQELRRTQEPVEDGGEVARAEQSDGELGAPERATPEPLVLALDPSELRDLVQLVALRQQIAPAEFSVEDVHRNRELLIRIAHSASFEERLSAAVGLMDQHVFLFAARSVSQGEFYPNFFVVRDGLTFRPDPANRRELGFLVGDAGPLPAGHSVLGYLVVPTRFDPRAELEIWWNDRSVRTTLRP